MKLLVVNGWSDDNKGDLAIVDGMISGLRDRFGEFTFKLLPSCNFEPSHHRFVSKIYGFDGILSQILPVHYPDAQNRVFRILRRVFDFVISLVILAFPKFALVIGGRFSALYGYYQQADRVVSKGGHIFSTNNKLLVGGYGLYCNLFPILFAKRLRKRTLVIAQSFGGFSHSAHKRMAGFALKGVEFIGAREEQSLKLMRSCGLTNSKLVWDTAFLIDPCDRKQKYIFEGGRFCVITIRPWSFPGKSNPLELYQSYLNEIISLVKFLEGEGISTVFVPQVRGPFRFEDDLRETRKIEEMLNAKRAFFVYDDMSPSELADLYSKAEFIVGTRFHSVILALSNCTPAVSISYSGFKATGIMDLLGLGDYVIDINCVSGGALIGLVERIIPRRGEVKAKLCIDIPRIRKELRLAFGEIKR